MKSDLRTRIEPDPAQETQELLGMLADKVSDLALRAARGDLVALELIKMVRDEAHTTLADLRSAEEI